jgi:hypothetical protein
MDMGEKISLLAGASKYGNTGVTLYVPAAGFAPYLKNK